MVGNSLYLAPIMHVYIYVRMSLSYPVCILAISSCRRPGVRVCACVCVCVCECELCTKL